MKKLALMLLLLAFSFSLMACGKDDKDKDDKKDSATPTVEANTDGTSDPEPTPDEGKQPDDAEPTPDEGKQPDDKDPGEGTVSQDAVNSEADAEALVSLLYENLLIKPDFRTALDIMYPEDVIEDLTDSILSEYDNPPEDFDFYKYMEGVFQSYVGQYEYWYKVVCCDDAYNPVELNKLANGNSSESSEDYEDFTLKAEQMLDAGTKAYAVLVTWGFPEDEDDNYEESDVVYVVCRNGRWYVTGDVL